MKILKNKEKFILIFILNLLIFVYIVEGAFANNLSTIDNFIHPNYPSAHIITFKVDTFTPGEKVKLIWSINGTYDNVKLSKREIDGIYNTLLDEGEDPGTYEDTTLESKKIYLYKLDVYSNGELQDTKRYFIFSSTDTSEGVRVLYNINLNDPDNHRYSVDMWIDTGSYNNTSLKTVANHDPEVRTLQITTWSSTSYAGSVSGDPDQDSGVVLSGPGIYFIHYNAELPPISTSDHGILGLFNNNFFMAADSQHLLLIKDEDGYKLSYVYRTYNTPTNWEVFSPEAPLEDKTYEIDFSDIDGCYYAYQEDSTLSMPKGTFYTEEKTIYGTNMRVVLDKRIEDYKKYPKYMFEIFENENKIFGEGVGKRYHVYVVHYDEEVYTSENTYSQGYSDRFRIVGEMFTHQIFHRWNGWPPYQTNFEPEEGYFRAFYTESFNNYFNDWNLTQVLPNYNWEMLRDYYHEYRTEYLNTPKDTPVALFGDGDPFIWYRKGPLVVYLLNQEIERVTNGEKTMVDVQREIWERYGHQNGTFDYEDIIQIINQITGTDFHPFFNDYVFGIKEIKIPEFE